MTKWERERERESEACCREREKACTERERERECVCVYFLLLNNRVGSEKFFPMHWEELFTSQGMEKGREAAVV
jgi:hypothetical protein